MSLAFIYCLSLFLLVPTACDSSPVGQEDDGIIKGQWESAGGSNFKTFRNHHYTFSVTQAGELNATIESNVSAWMYLLDDRGIVLQNRRSVSTSIDAGTYTLVAAAGNGQSAAYTLTISGPVSNINRIFSDIKEIEGDWISAGGTNHQTFRNRHFTFKATQDTYLNVLITSNVSAWMYLLDDRGNVLQNGRSVSASIDAGTYTLVAAAGNGQSSAYELTLFGHIDNLR